MTSWLSQLSDPDGRWQIWGRYAFPAAAPNVRQWFVRSLLAPGGGRERLARRLADKLPFRLAEAAAGRSVRVGRRTTSELDGDLAPLRAVLASDDTTALLAAHGDNWQVLVEFSEPAVTRSRLIAFLFAPGGAQPDLVVRIRLTADLSERETMWQHVQRLRQRLPSDIQATMPRVVGRVLEGDLSAELCEVLPGRSGYSRLLSCARPKAECEAQLEHGLDWLGRFHHATAVPPAAEDRLPQAASHGDFWVRNILLEGDRVSGVLDWEESSATGPMSRDVVTFLLSAAEVYQRRNAVRDPVEAFRRSFIEAGWFRDCAERSLDRYRDRFQRDLPALEVMLRREFERRLGARQAPEKETSLRRCLCLL